MADLASLIVEILLVWPFTMPNRILEPDVPPPCGWSFAVPPFARDTAGYIVPARCLPAAEPYRSDAPPRREPASRWLAGQAGVEGLTAIDGSYGRLGGRMRLLTAFRVELDNAYVAYVRWPGRSSPGWLGQTHVDVRFAQNERIQFRVGAGVRERFVGGSAAAGFDALYAVDVFWPRRVALTLEFSGGTFGPKGWAGEVRATAGYLAGAVELYAGWDGTWLAEQAPQPQSVGGPVLGARVYF